MGVGVARQLGYIPWVTCRQRGARRVYEVRVRCTLDSRLVAALPSLRR